MADSQPPEGLQPKIAPFATDDVDAAVTALANNAYLGEEGPLDRDDMEEIARLVLSSASARGRLLPSGGEASYRVVWTGKSGIEYIENLDDDQDPQQRLRDHLELTGVVVRAHLERRIVTPWSPVLSDNSEVPNGQKIINEEEPHGHHD